MKRLFHIMMSGFVAVLCMCSCCNEGRVVKLMSYNVGVFSKEIEDSSPLIARLIESVGAETVGLNEIDSCNTRHMADQLAVLQEHLGEGWSRQYARAMAYRGGAYGDGVVTREQVIKSGMISLPIFDGSEPRAVAYVETPDYVFAGLHLDHVSENARLEQVKVATAELKKLFGSCGKPIFLAGDFNSEPGNDAINKAEEDWEILTPLQPSFPADAPNECIDYIMLLKGSPSVEVIRAGVCTQDQFSEALGPDTAPNILSDHLPLYLEVRIKN